MPSKYRVVAKRLALLLLLAAIVGGWIAVSMGRLTFSDLEALLHAYPRLAPFLFIIAHVIAAIAFLPCSPFALLAGLLWPLTLALPISIVATLAATTATFVIGRYIKLAALRSEIESSPAHRLLAFTSRHGWRVVALAFLNPALPSATLGYAFGMSSISLASFVWSAFLSMIPLQVTLVALGGMVRNALLFKVWVASWVLLVLAALAIGLWVFMRRKWALTSEKGGNCEPRD